MRCPDGHGEMKKVDFDLTSSTKVLWRCPKCRKLIQVFYARVGADELQTMVDVLSDEDDNATS